MRAHARGCTHTHRPGLGVVAGDEVKVADDVALVVPAGEEGEHDVAEEDAVDEEVEELRGSGGILFLFLFRFNWCVFFVIVIAAAISLLSSYF